MADKIKSLDQDFIFGEIDTEAMLRAEIKRLRAALKPFAVLGASEMLKDAETVTVTDIGIFKQAAAVMDDHQ